MVKNKIVFKKYLRAWIKKNSHNYTTPSKIYPEDLITIGRKSYGEINVEFFNNLDEKLIIGNFVSIANNVTFITGGEHTTSIFSTYPLYSKYIVNTPEIDAKTKGKIIVEDDVWIGYGAIILSGVRIGKGAIIGAGSVVTKDVEAFTLTAGNPAKKIKKRFDKDSENIVLQLNLNKLTDQQIMQNIDLFYSSLEGINELFEKQNK